MVNFAELNPVCTLNIVSLRVAIDIDPREGQMQMLISIGLGFIISLTLCSPLAQTTQERGLKTTPQFEANRTPVLSGKGTVSPPEPTVAIKSILAVIDRQLAAKEYSASLAAADSAVKAAQSANDAVGEAMAELRRALSLRGMGRIDESKEASRVGAAVIHNQGVYAFRENDLRKAEMYYRLELSIQTKFEPGSLDAAMTLNSIGLLKARQRQFKSADECFKQSLAIREAEDPQSMLVADSLNNLGAAAYEVGNYLEAESYHSRALSIRESHGRVSLQVARSLTNLGDVALKLNRFKAAREYYSRAFDMLNSLSAEPQQLATTLNDLGTVSRALYDLAAADDYYKRAQQLIEKFAPGSSILGSVFYNRGLVAKDRHDSAAAVEFFNRSLAIRNSLTKESLDVAACLQGLGDVADDRGEINSALSYYEQALNIRRALSPGSRLVADSLIGVGNVHEDLGEFVVARRSFEQAREILRLHMDRSTNIAMISNSIGNLEEAVGNLSSAQSLYTKALAISQSIEPESYIVVQSLVGLGNIADDRDNLIAARRYLENALDIQERHRPNDPQNVRILIDLGVVSSHAGDLVGADRYFNQALSIARAKGPASPDEAACLCNLSVSAYSRGDLVTAESSAEKARNLYKVHNATGLDLASALDVLGNISEDRGDLIVAGSCYEQASTIVKQRAPHSTIAAVTLNNLGRLASAHGDLRSSEDYFKKALEIQIQRAPESPDAAAAFNNLGLVARIRGDLMAAEAYFRSALRIYRKRAPATPEWAGAMHNLGTVADQAGDPSTARYRYNLALGIRQKLSPDSIQVADTLNNLGNSEFRRNKLSVAGGYYTRARDIYFAKAPGSAHLAACLENLGNVANRLNDLSTAEQFYQQATDILNVVGPYSPDLAATLSDYGTVFLKRHQPQQAVLLFERAIGILESQRKAIAGTDAARLFIEEYFSAYTNLFDTYIALGQYTNAYNTIERERGRGLAENLFKHQSPSLRAQVPKPLQLQQQDIQNRWSMTLAQRLAIELKSPDHVTKLAQNDAVLRQIETEQRQWHQELLRISPSVASLNYADPVTEAEAQDKLDTGTLLLEFAITDSNCYLFTLTKSTFNWYPLCASRKVFDAEIGEFTRSVANATSPVNSKIAIKLYRHLLGPAIAEISAADRLLICPEHELWRVPFCALIDNDHAEATKRRYLIESKPIHYTISMNVYRETVNNRRRSRTAGLPLLALGDPVFGAAVHNGTTASRISQAKATRVSAPKVTSSVAQTTRPAPQLGSAVLGDITLTPPITGDQVRAISNLFGPSAVVKIERNATAGIVYRLGGTADIVHFACHCLLNKNDSLASFLLLAPDGDKQQYGTMAAYDVMERLHLNADLATLAACQTGDGNVSASEGVIGMARAFQYAGAQSVIASLWAIDADSSTLLFSGAGALNRGKNENAVKNSFYGLLRARSAPADDGSVPVTKDVALQKAQIALIHGRRLDYRNPNCWAAFSLYGDWK